MKSYSVLIIDDDIWMQRILSKTLQSYGFKSTYLTSNGFEGLDIAIENVPDLIILDILMPELSGLVILKILKNIKITKNIPVIMVSALSDTENLGLAVKGGTAGFISKPFTKATVYEKLIAIFGKDKLDRIIKGDLIKDSNTMNTFIPTQTNEFENNKHITDDLSIDDFKTDIIDKKDDIDSIKRFLQKVKK